MSDLPKGWTSCHLQELLTSLESGSRPKGGVRGIADGVPSLGGEHLTYKGGFDFSSIKFVPSDFAERMTKGQIKTNDILIVKDGATTGKTAYVGEGFPFKNAVVNEHVFICRSTKLIEPQFLFRYLTSKEGQDRILENFQGSAQGGINLSFASNTEIPLAPLNEQKLITEKLEKLLSKVEGVQARMDKLPTILKRFRQAVLAAACSGKLTADWRLENSNIDSAKILLDRISDERISSTKKQKCLIKSESKEPFAIPQTWQFCVFDEISAVRPNAIKAGPFGSSLTKSVYVPSGYKIYGQEQVIRGNPYYGDYYIDEAKFRELQTCEVQAGDILVSLVGTIGKTLIVPDDFEKGIINPRLVKFSLHPKIYNRFIEKYLNSTIAQNLLSQDSHGGTMEILNLGILRNLPIPLPPLEEQKEIVRRVEDLFKFADQIEARYKKARSYTDKLAQSILAKAFRGELVPQDETDEPASILLERIKSEKTKDSGKSQKPKLKALGQSNLFG